MLLVVLVLGACDDDPVGPSPEPTPPGGPSPPGELVVSETVTLDPTGFAPLTAVIDIETSEPVSLVLRVRGRRGPESDVRRHFAAMSQEHSIPVLGLYADHQNQVELDLLDSSGETLDAREYSIQTSPANQNLPEVMIDVDGPGSVEGMTLVSYFGHAGTRFPNRPFIFDRFGDIRWVLDYAGHPELGDLSYDDGVERLANGNLYFGNQRNDQIYEVDMTGRIVNTWEMPGFGFHHEVFEKPDGNFLVTTHNRSVSTIEDHVIEIERTTGAIVRVWNLRESLDRTRRTWSNEVTDWAHLNAVSYDDRDGTIIVSARHQGLVKLTADNDVVWILAPHRGWETAGDGTDLSSRLLKPLDSTGAPIEDVGVLSGETNHPDFEWNWYQHAPLVTPEGDVMLFDNGDNRNYTETGPYSRAVRYEIDEAAMTVRQVWSYGKARGPETFSRFVSDVDYDAGSGHVFFSPGAVDLDFDNYGKVVEIDPAGDVVFEATIIPPQPYLIVTFHRTERLSLYP